MNRNHTFLVVLISSAFVFTVFGQSTESLMNTGMRLLQNGANSQAATKFRKVIARDPNNFEAQHNLAFAYLQMGRYNEAVAHFKNAIQLNGKNAEAWTNLAIAYEGLGKNSKVLDALYNAVTLSPNDINSRLNLATMYANENKFKSAIYQYEAVIAIDGTIQEAYVNAAKCYKNLGNWKAAKRHLKELLSFAPQNAEAHYDLGTILWKKEGAIDAAVKEFQTAINLNRSSKVYYNDLAQLYVEQNKKDEAIELYRQWMVYLDDALLKEKIRDRIDQLEQGSGAVSAGLRVEMNTADQIKALQSEMRSEEKKEVKTMKTESMDVSDDFDDLLNDDGGTESDLDMTDELNKRTK